MFVVVLLWLSPLMDKIKPVDVTDTTTIDDTMKSWNVKNIKLKKRLLPAERGSSRVSQPHAQDTNQATLHHDPHQIGTNSNTTWSNEDNKIGTHTHGQMKTTRTIIAHFCDTMTWASTESINNLSMLSKQIIIFFAVHIEETKRSRASLRLQKRSESACEKSTRATSCGNDQRPYNNIRT